jgi:hypothetical protein
VAEQELRRSNFTRLGVEAIEDHIPGDAIRTTTIPPEAPGLQAMAEGKDALSEAVRRYFGATVAFIETAGIRIGGLVR